MAKGEFVLQSKESPCYFLSFQEIPFMGDKTNLLANNKAGNASPKPGIQCLQTQVKKSRQSRSGEGNVADLLTKSLLKGEMRQKEAFSRMNRNDLSRPIQ
ncbi:MAG: hypothetical protein NZ602_13255 [Thermoguttaceae bacterium]|nr:hypothetical protein [Thermoguttaceae bacterium]MDW8039275.1 hypothetical protein [Thermoguttaceae bacterium]